MIRSARWILLLGVLALAGCQREAALPVLSEVEPLTLVDTAGAPFPLDELRGEVWIAHFIFTRCGGPCPRMAAELASLQRALGPMEGLEWVSISADPSYDRPPVMAEYGARFGADPSVWHLLTGEAEAISQLAERSFLLPIEPSEASGGLITHSLKMAVVDAQMRVRAFHDHFQDDNAERLGEEVEALLREAR